MLTGLLVLAGLVAPLVIYFVRETKQSTPSLRWPVLAQALNGFQFSDKPPRLLGDWDGRHVAVELHNEKVLVTMQLVQPSRLRVEVGPRAEVERRAGMVVPDGVATGDSSFEGRLMARCSDKAAGAAIFDPALRQRLMAQPHVDAIGAGQKVQWVLPELRDVEILERALEVMTAVASEMERFPANA